MLGVVLLSEYNELIHAFGNNEFRAHFNSVPTKNGRRMENGCATIANGCTTTDSTRPTSSSSSGISSSTSTACSLPPTTSSARRDHKTARERGKGEGNATTQKGAPEDDIFREKNGEENSQHRLDESLLLQQLMPLVLLCRAKQQQNGQKIASENIESIFCPKSLLHFRIAFLSHSNLLALIHGERVLCPPSSAERLFTFLLRCVRYHYGGPSLQLIPLRSAFVQLLNERCEHRMLRLLSEAADDDAPFCQNMNFDGPSRLIRRTLLPHFKEISRQFAARIGRRCRCLFLHSARLIASVSSHNGERTTAALRHDDLRSLLQFARQSPPAANDGNAENCDGRKGSGDQKLRKCHAELGIWLYSKNLRRRQLHNVFVLSLNNRLEIICAAPAEDSHLISTVWEALDSVDNLSNISAETPSSNIDLLLERCDRLLSNEHKMLDVLMNKSKMRTPNFGGGETQFGQKTLQQSTFLENVPRTQRLLKHHWSKLKNSLNSLSTHHQQQQEEDRSVSVRSPFGVEGQRQLSSFLSRLQPSMASPRLFVPSLSRHPSNNQWTISSTGSTFGQPRAHSSAAFSSTSFSSSRFSSAFLDAMRAQLKRVQRSLLDELLAWDAFRTRSQILPSLQLAVHHSMGPQMAKALAQLDAELCKSATSGQSPLRPTILGFDMIAYQCVRVGSPSLCLHYVPEDNAKQMLDKLMFMEDFVGEERTFDGASDSSNAEDIAFVRTADGELLIRLCHPNPCPSQSENPNEQNAQNVCVTPSQNYASHSSSILTVLTAPLAARLGKVSRDFLSGQNANFATTSYRCTVIFSHHTNTSLAVRQTSALMDKLSAEMERNIVPNFH